MSVAATYEAKHSGWLRSTPFDLFFIVGIAAIALLSGAIVAVEPRWFLPILFLDLWLLGYHHVISTYTRLCFDSESMKEHRFLLFGLPPIVLGGVIALAFGVGFWTIATIYLYWQWFHYTRQSWGVQQAYLRKSSVPVTEDERLTKAAFYLLPLWGILYRSYQDPGKFLGMELWVFPVPLLVVQVAAAAAIVVCGIWAWQRAQAFIRGEGPVAHTLYMASHATVFGVGYLLIEDITYGWLVINIWHNAQYVLFVWLFNAKKFSDGETVKAQFLSKISQPQNWWMYFGFCLLLTSIIYVSLSKVAAGLETLAIPAVMIIYQTINFHHYIVDSVIWKLRKPKMQSVLGLSNGNS